MIGSFTERIFSLNLERFFLFLITKYKKQASYFKKEELKRKLETENIDVTEPSKKINLGSLHPITQIIQEVEEIFLGMGYEIADGPEVEKAIGKSGEKEEMESLMLLNFYKKVKVFL